MKKSDRACIAMPTALMFLALGLAGCGTSTPQPINIDRAELMPEAAATKIIAQWVPNYRGGGFVYISGDASRLGSVKDLVYSVQRNRLRFPTGAWTSAGDICSISLEQAKQFAEALAALGAPVILTAVDEPLGDGVPCTRVRGSP